MITAQGFMKHDDFVEMLKNARIIEIVCPKCQDMTRSEYLDRGRWYCYECNTIFIGDPDDYR